MIEVRREGRNGNLLEENGPVLYLAFSDMVVQSIFRGEDRVYRYMETRHRRLFGFAPEDKFWIKPVDRLSLPSGENANVNLYTDPGCDVFLELTTDAGDELEDSGYPRKFALDEITHDPSQLLERGIDTLVIEGLIGIREEKVAREQYGLSRVDPKWEASRA